MNTKIILHILLNPVAGNGKSKKAYAKLIQFLKQKKIEYSTHSSSYSGNLTDIAQKYGNSLHSKNEILLVIGGDGSLNEVVNGIKRSQHPDTAIAYLPAGSGNDFARAAGLTNNPYKLVNQLLQNYPAQQVDCGFFVDNDIKNEPIYFINNFGIGLDAYIVNRSNSHSLKKKLNKINFGNLVYVSNIFNALIKQNTFSVTVRANEKEYKYDNVYFTTTTNHPYFGGGVAILPKANIYSHVLDTVVVQKPNFIKFIKLFTKLIKDGSHVNDPLFHYIEAQEIHIKTNIPEYSQIDGESGPYSKYDITFKIDYFNLRK
ncbi:transcriptional regulator [Lactobacillus hamsteri DSM 5661 = JCM 6256]|uniref:Transcriptional regulator n=1 Tax=Lactobacillus hamsteri DSM 5661 = JCM 6256 TaxID=1423754 RepID=A0A0R1Y4U5_9LACO|nr:diacylglycerol kinase family protein [Lactobacillus hamsteri]KRM37199.1 transcriptional regulator [Lactobacillus hamsteri DSM 5661 = JCM 6256]